MIQRVLIYKMVRFALNTIGYQIKIEIEIIMFLNLKEEFV